MTEEETKILINYLSDLSRTVRGLTTILSQITSDLHLLTTLLIEIKNPSKQQILKTLFPHLFPD